jgi:hypothetical protein
VGDLALLLVAPLILFWLMSYSLTPGCHSLCVLTALHLEKEDVLTPGGEKEEDTQITLEALQ